MRYVVETIKKDSKDMWKNQTVYKVKDIYTGLLSLSSYTSLEVAQEKCKEKNDAN
jgi:hypothetical protein